MLHRHRLLLTGQGHHRRHNTIHAERTGQTLAQIEKDSDRDNYMSAAEGAQYGLIDRVLATREGD
ncbi:ATP-dependent Clp protease proteolytic subunit [Massilia scottii]|uniref:ATP-dependent Clp protease proteolytic subunit n=1 Tax=Massilia scottii TaxID=3057166 RepID=UPI0027B8F8C7|nr:ATP-dependent Clp protease proteolytic subunit [Massilia sp. CCM 9210]